MSDDFHAWRKEGEDKGWISPAYCVTHDGGYEYFSEEESKDLEDGGDPCQVVFSILNQ
jgi:hypothetical protein